MGYGYFEQFDERGAAFYDWLVKLRLFDWAYKAALAALEAAAPPGFKVLEVGPGVGRLLGMLERRGYVPYGVDVSPAMLKRAKARSAADLVNAGSWRMPLRRYFDAAVAVFTVHHWGDHASSVDSLACALKPGAPFVVVEVDQRRAPAHGHGCSEDCLRASLGGRFSVEVRRRWPLLIATARLEKPSC